MSSPATVTQGTAAPSAEWVRFLGALRRARARLSEDPQAQLTLSQYLLVAPLLDAPTRSVGELAANAGVASPTATRMLDGLERDGIIRREVAAHDRRCTALRLTPAGRRKARAERDRYHAKAAELFAGFDAAEREHAERVLDRLADLIEAL